MLNIWLTLLQVEDFRQLDAATQNAKSVAIIGGGFLGSELACALGKRGKFFKNLKPYFRDDLHEAKSQKKNQTGSQSIQGIFSPHDHR